MKIRTTIILTLFVLTGITFSRFSEIFVEYKDGNTEVVKKAEFKETVFFHTKGRSVVINPKKLQRVDVFSDTIQIYYGETWVRADVYPSTKDSIPSVHKGFIKISTILTGDSDFGKLSILISELKSIDFRSAKERAEEETEEIPADTVSQPVDTVATQLADTTTQTEDTVATPIDTTAEITNE